MVWAYAKEMHRYLVTRCERLAIVGLRRGRGKWKKDWGEVIRHDIVCLQITDDMTFDRKIWRSKIRIES